MLEKEPQGESVRNVGTWRGTVGHGRVGSRPFFKERWCWFAVSLMVLSSIVVLPTALPSAAAAPYKGQEPTPTNLTVFLHNTATSKPIVSGIFSSNLTTTGNDTAPPWAGTGGLIVGLHYLDMGFYLYPSLAAPLTLNGTPVADIYVNQTGSVSSVTWTFTLYAVDTSGVEHQLGTPGTGSTNLDDGSIGKVLRVPYGSSLLTTVPAGWSLLADFNQYTSGATSDHYGFWWGDVGGAYYEANINLPASTYLAINQTYLTMGGKQVVNLNTTVAHTIVNLTANVSDPLGNYDYLNWSVNWNITNASNVVMAAGTLKAVRPVVPPVFNAPNETYNVSYNYSSLKAGSYLFCANATDNTYHNDLAFAGKYYGRDASGCTSFFLGSAPNLLTLHVLDSKGVPLRHAYVTVSGILNFTNGTGVTHFHLANGTYGGVVTWEGIVVATPSINVSGPTVLTIATRVYYPTFAVEDQLGFPLSNALVYVVHPNGTHYPLIITNATGNLSFMQVPGGSYGITVIWHDSVVYSQPAQPAILVNGNGAFTVVTQVYYQVFQVVEPSGAPISLSSVVVQNSTTGVLVSFGITNSSGKTTSRIPAGTFTVDVYWQTSLIASVPNLKLPATNYSTPYVITASLYTVNFLALDSKGLPVAGAVIEVSGPGGPITNLVTTSAGTASVVLPGGTYTFATLWEGVTVNTTTVTVSSSSTLTLNLAIYYLTLTGLDAAKVPAGGAVVTYDTSVGAANGTLLLPANGTGTVRLPGATYALAAYWEGIQVGATSLTLTSSVTEVLSLSIYYLTFDAVDAAGLAVSAASIQWTTPVGQANGSISTNSSGGATVRLPGASYALKTTWEGVVVNTTSTDLVNTVTLRLDLSVYYLTFHAVDAKGIDVSEATISWGAPVGTANGSVTTNSTGEGLARLPGTTYSFIATWKGVLVNETSFSLRSSVTWVLSLAIYYLAFQADDAKGIPVSGATVSLTLKTGPMSVLLETPDNGSVVARVPTGNYTVSVVWEGVSVYNGETLATADTDVPLALSIYYQTFQAEDAKGIAVDGATLSITMSNGPVALLIQTAANGSAVARLPGGDYNIGVTWDDVTVYQGSFSATADASVPLALKIYYLTVDTQDKGGSPLPGVFLQVFSTTTGATVASATTTSQPTVFRLPVGSYAVVGTYKGTYDLTPVQQTLNQTVSLTSSSQLTMEFSQVNPAFTATNEFYAIMGFVALIALLVIIGAIVPMLKKRKSKQDGDKTAVVSTGAKVSPASSEPVRSTGENTSSEASSSKSDESWKE